MGERNMAYEFGLVLGERSDERGSLVCASELNVVVEVETGDAQSRSHELPALHEPALCVGTCQRTSADRLSLFGLKLALRTI